MKERIRNAFQQLRDALAKLGVDADVRDERALIARGPVPKHEGVTDSGLAELMKPRALTQVVTVRPHDGDLWWHWVWAADKQGQQIDEEPMLPLARIDDAARRIQNVVAVAESRIGES